MKHPYGVQNGMIRSTLNGAQTCSPNVALKRSKTALKSAEMNHSKSKYVWMP